MKTTSNIIKAVSGQNDTKNINTNKTMGCFEKLVNSPNASEFASEIGFVGKERDEYFYLLYLQNLTVSNYDAYKSFRMRMAIEISEIAGDKPGNQSTVWDIVSALDTLYKKGGWEQDKNCIRGDVKAMALYNLWSNMKNQLTNIIISFNFDKELEDEVMDKVFGLNFDNPYAA